MLFILTTLPEYFLYANFVENVGGFPDSSASKEPACNSGDPVPSLGCEEPLEKGMVTQSSILSGEFHG